MAMEISPLENERVPDKIPAETIIRSADILENKNSDIIAGVNQLKSWSANVENSELSESQKRSARTYLGVLERFLRVSILESQLSQAMPKEILEKKKNKKGLEAAYMDQDMMFVIRKLRTQPSELLEKMHEVLHGLTQKYPKYMNSLENYDNLVGGVMTEMAVIEALSDMNRRYSLKSMIVKSKPEDDAGLNPEKNKVDFTIGTNFDGGLEYSKFQVKSRSGMSDDRVELTHVPAKPILLDVNCRRREDYIDLITGEYNNDFMMELMFRFVDIKNKQWRFNNGK